MANKVKITGDIEAHLFKNDSDSKGSQHNLKGMEGEVSNPNSGGTHYTSGAPKEQWFTPAGFKTSVLIHPKHFSPINEAIKGFSSHSDWQKYAESHPDHKATTIEGKSVDIGGNLLGDSSGSRLWHKTHENNKATVRKGISEDGGAGGAGAAGGAVASNVSGGTNLSSASGQLNAPNTTNLEGYSLPFKKKKRSNHTAITVKEDIFRRLTEMFGPRSDSANTSQSGGAKTDMDAGKTKVPKDDVEVTEAINELIKSGERVLLECEGTDLVSLIIR